MNLFRRKLSSSIKLEVDMHSHLIPKIDDGSQSMEQSLEMIEFMASMGYQKIITTPHIISDLYPNKPEEILRGFAELKNAVEKANIKVELEAAAEHYLDEFLIEALERGQILLIKGNYILFETSFMAKPANFEEFIFKAKSKGLKPILAHPERYIYFQNDWKLVQETIDRGVLFQINISSLSGYYSKPAKHLAEKIIKAGWVHFFGTDAHHIEQLELCRSTLTKEIMQRALKLPILNSDLL